MKEIEILIAGSQYKISCKETQKDRLVYLANKLSKRIDKISQNIKNNSTSSSSHNRHLEKISSSPVHHRHLERSERSGEAKLKEISRFARDDSEEKNLLVMAALTLEDELEKKSESLTSKEENEGGEINDQDIYDAVSDNIENITDYIETLTEKIKKL